MNNSDMLVAIHHLAVFININFLELFGGVFDGKGT